MSILLFSDLCMASVSCRVFFCPDAAGSEISYKEDPQ